jgi:hypothetical protein
MKRWIVIGLAVLALVVAIYYDRHSERTQYVAEKIWTPKGKVLVLRQDRLGWKKEIQQEGKE